MSFTRQELQAIQAEMKAAAAEIAARHGFSIDTVKGVYGDRLDVKIGFKRAGVAGIEDERAKFDQSAPYYGLEGKYKHRVTVQGHVLELTGFRHPTAKRVVLVRDVHSGKGFCIDADTAKRAVAA